MGTGVLFWSKADGGGNLTTRLQLVPRLGMTGAILLLPLYAFMVWTRQTSLYYPIGTAAWA